MFQTENSKMCVRQDSVVRDQSLFGVNNKGWWMGNGDNVRYQNQKSKNQNYNTRALWLSQS